MTPLPPPGWYPDPQTAGGSWRWWDGRQWAAVVPVHDPARATRARDQAERYGRWLRYGMVGTAVNALFVYAASGWLLSDLHDRWFTTTSDGMPHLSGRFIALQLLSAPLGMLGFAFLALLIAWIYQAGEFAEAMGWPSTRGRVLGAFSVLIPVVGLWWPYEAIRDAYPPGVRPGIVLRWWVSYLVVPVATGIVVVVVALIGTTTILWITVALAAASLSVPVALGWRLIDDLDRAQRAAE